MPVPIPMAIAMFFTMWWTVLFAVLPFGVRSQVENESIVPGTDPGAPQAPRLLIKVLWTTGISIVLYTALMLFIKFYAQE
jgi:predicted secreted protein